MARIAFLACNKRADGYAQNSSFVYRCMNLAHGVRMHGHEAWCGHLTALPWSRHWDVAVLHRPRATWRMKAVTAWLRRRGTRVLADVDDLIIDPELAPYSPGVVNGLVKLRATQKLFAAHKAALAYVDGVTVSTLPLQHEMRRVMPAMNVAVIPNAVHHSWWNLPLPSPDKPAPVMAYMPGTRSHDRDFALITPALERVLQRHPNARLQVTGPLRLTLQARPGQVLHRQKLPFDQYHRCFEGVSINLAPLEDSPFTRCKSALKVMEAAWWNIPTVCADFPDAHRFDGLGALRAKNVQAFEEHLETLLADADALRQHSSGLRERVRGLADVRAQSRRWLDFALPGRKCGTE